MRGERSCSWAAMASGVARARRTAAIRYVMENTLDESDTVERSRPLPDSAWEAGHLHTGSVQNHRYGWPYANPRRWCSGCRRPGSDQLRYTFLDARIRSRIHVFGELLPLMAQERDAALRHVPMSNEVRLIRRLGALVGLLQQSAGFVDGALRVVVGLHSEAVFLHGPVALAGDIKNFA